MPEGIIWCVDSVTRNTTIQQLLSEKDLKLDAAVRLAHSMEAADANVMKLQNDNHTAPINRTDGFKSQEPRKNCYRCGGNDHAPTACCYKGNKCREHLAKVYKNSERRNFPPSNRFTQPPRDAKPPASRNPSNKK